MHTYGIFEKIGTVYLGLCIPNVKYMNEPKDWISNTISVSAFDDSNCQSQINLLLRAAISYRGGSFCQEPYRVPNSNNQC